MFSVKEKRSFSYNLPVWSSGLLFSVKDGCKWCALLWTHVLDLSDHLRGSCLLCWSYVRSYPGAYVSQPSWSRGSYKVWPAQGQEKCRLVYFIIRLMLSIREVFDNLKLYLSFRLYFLTLQKRFCRLLKTSTCYSAPSSYIMPWQWRYFSYCWLMKLFFPVVFLFTIFLLQALPIFIDALLPAWASILISVTLILAFGEVIWKS